MKTAKENAMENNTKNATRNLKPGTKVVSKTDAEPGTIVGVATFRRNGIDAWSYLVDTAYGREIWEAGEIFLVPADA
jgi:hypothetical protein